MSLQQLQQENADLKQKLQRAVDVLKRMKAEQLQHQQDRELIQRLQQRVRELESQLQATQGGAAPQSNADAALDDLLENLDVSKPLPPRDAALDEFEALFRDDGGVGASVTAAAPPARSRAVVESDGFGEEDIDEATINIMPGASMGGRAEHVVHETEKGELLHDEKVMVYKFDKRYRDLPPQRSFKPIEGKVVPYLFVSNEQLHADIKYLSDLKDRGEISNATLQKQRDHMIVESRGGRKFGAVWTEHANFRGRQRDEQFEEEWRRFEEEN